MADAEGNQRPDVAENGLADGEGKLIDILVGEGEAEAVFAGFGQDGRKGVGAETLEFVNEKIKIATVLFRLISSRHGGELELGGQQGTEEVGLVVAQAGPWRGWR